MAMPSLSELMDGAGPSGSAPDVGEETDPRRTAMQAFIDAVGAKDVDAALSAMDMLEESEMPPMGEGEDEES